MFACRCAERKKDVGSRRWVITQRYCNHSAFNGYHRTASDYSTVWCLGCECSWRTKAAFVAALRDATDEDLGIKR